MYSGKKLTRFAIPIGDALSAVGGAMVRELWGLRQEGLRGYKFNEELWRNYCCFGGGEVVCGVRAVLMLILTIQSDRRAKEPGRWLERELRI